MPATAPTPDYPDANLLAYEAELESLVIEWQTLDEAWPRGKTAMARYEIGCRLEACLERIAELREPIAETEATTLAGAAVQLRRLDAMLGGDERQAVGLLGSALKMVEAE